MQDRIAAQYLQVKDRGHIAAQYMHMPDRIEAQYLQVMDRIAAQHLQVQDRKAAQYLQVQDKIAAQYLQVQDRIAALSGNRGSLNIVLITEDKKVRNFTVLRDPSTNNLNTGNKSLDNCTKKII